MFDELQHISPSSPRISISLIQIIFTEMDNRIVSNMNSQHQQLMCAMRFAEQFIKSSIHSVQQHVVNLFS